MPGLYLEPIGLISGHIAKEAVALGGALPLAGGPLAFDSVRLWEGEPGKVKHAIVRISTIQAIDEPRIKELLDRIVSRRAPIAGVPMDRPHIMGIVNVTPDSFSDGGEHFETGDAISHATRLASEGASFIDIGGESTRPGAVPVPVEEEQRRLLPVLEALRDLGAPLSADTRKPEVMREAAKAGAAMFNDISALTFAENSLSTAAELKKPIVLMHAQGDPRTMQDDPSYVDVVMEVYDYLESRIEAAVSAGLSRESLIADPGIGFGKTAAHNRALLQSISVFHGLGVPILTGTSRKGFIQKVIRAKDPKERDAASVAAAIDAVSQGVQIVRVHDVLVTHQALCMWRYLRGADGDAADHF